MKKILHIDIETYSERDIKHGAYYYASCPIFEVLLFSYAINDEETKTISIIEGQTIPESIVKDLKDESVIKSAFNANFERICLYRYLGVELSPESWECSSAHSLLLGLPGNLKEVAKVLNCKNQKMEASNILKYFTQPCSPTKANSYRKRNLPQDDPEKWAIFKKYNGVDVEVEREIKQKLNLFPLTPKERKIYILDQKINDTGPLIDTELVGKAIVLNQQLKETAYNNAKNICGLDNPNSIQQVRAWLAEQGVETEDLKRETVEKLVKNSKLEVSELMELRLKMSKSSNKKYAKIASSVLDVNRLRGLFQYAGASRTGRWAGRGVQVHNLPKSNLNDLDLARSIVKESCLEGLNLLYAYPAEVLSQLIRTVFIAPEGARYIVADFAAIEARVLAWVANEEWRLNVFASDGKIYENSASKMFGVPVIEITKGSELRSKGKVAELALGYQGGVNALIKMGALDMGIANKELQGIVDAWRTSNPNIVSVWKMIENLAIRAIREKKSFSSDKLTFEVSNNILFIGLPSGRRLAYAKPKLAHDAKYGKEIITFEGVDSTSKRWAKQSTYGGKLTENVVQAVSRDILAESLLNLDAAGYKIVLHVHDEVIMETKINEGSLGEVCAVMEQRLPWADGLILKAEGFESAYYKKG